MKPYQILVVEDESIVAMDIEDRLVAMGYALAGRAASGEQALLLVKERHPDLVLMDIRLQGFMNGIDAAEQIREGFHIPVIFLTAYSEEETLERAKRAQPFGYILKPFDDRELKSTIEIALFKHRAEEEIRRLNRLYDVLSQVNQAIVRISSRQELLDTICRLVVERGAVDLAWIGWLDPATSRIVPLAHFGDRSEILNESDFFADDRPEGHGTPGKAIREGKPFVCNQCDGATCLYPSPKAPSQFGFQSCASFPLEFQGNFRGALILCVAEAGFFHDREIELMREVAMDVSFALNKIENETQRKQAEMALSASEARLRLFIEYAPASLAMFDREMRYLSVSRRWLSDYHLEGRDLTGLSHYDVFPEIPERWKEVHRRVLAGEVVWAEEDRFERADGSVQWLHWEVRPWRNLAGDVAGIVIFSEDITERKQAEERIRKLSLVQAALHDPGTLHEKLKRITDGVVDIFDADFARIWLLRPGDLCKKGCMHAHVTQGIHACLHRERCLHLLANSGRYTQLDGEAHRRVPFGCYKIGRIASGEEPSFLTNDVASDQRVHNREWAKELGLICFAGYQLRPPHGETVGVLALFSKHPISSEEDALLKSLSNLVVPVIQTIQAEEEARENEMRLNLAVEAAQAGVWDWDIASDKVVWSETTEALFGYAPGTFPGTIDGFKQRVHPDDLPGLWEAAEKPKTTGGFFEHEYRVLWPDGSMHWVTSHGRILFDPQGEPARMVGVLFDITEHKRAEEEKAELESRLRQAQKLEAIGTLAGGIAHDFNNILAAIMGYAEIADIKLPQDSPIKRDLHEVLRATQRARDLVQQILTFSRKGESELKPLQIIPVIKETVNLLRATLPTTIAIHHEIGLPEGDDVVSGDPTQIHQILMNLTTNAAHAMREHGGKLTVTLSSIDFGPGDIGRPEKLALGRYLKLTVEDTGHGMDQATIERIFDPYFTTKGLREGTGLGLAVVHGIVKSHGGAIEVYSEPGKGTAFHIYLPKLGSRDSSQKAEAYAPIPRGSETILLVDDEASLADTGKQMLEHLGYKVTAVTSSAEALDLFRRQPQHFDLLITDFTMPEMTGIDLARQIAKSRPEMPIILCTGFSEMIDEDSARNMGISAFLMKPISLRTMAEVIRKILRNGEN